MCINKPYKKIWPAEYWCFADQTQYTRNATDFNDFKGIIFNSPNVTARKNNQTVLQSKPGYGFSTNVKEAFYMGQSSTYMGLQIANHINYDKIYVFGCDMGEVNGKLWHYGDNPDVKRDTRKQRFNAEAKHFEWAGKNLSPAIKNKFVFCSKYNKWPFVELFPKLDQDKAIEEILKSLETKDIIES